MSFLEDGVLNLNDIHIPKKERFEKGSVAIIECVQEIPCDPCVDSCPQRAVTISDSINNVPNIDFDRCNGCALCISNCPGLAIFLIDTTFEENRALVGIPYEFIPLPEIHETVFILGRSGQICGEGEVIRIRNTRKQDRTPIVFLAVQKQLAMVVRHFTRKTNEKR